MGMRFVGLQVPQGAKITKAYLEFEVDEADSEQTSLIIEGEDADSSAGFQSASGNVSGRPRTTERATWAPGGWGTVGQGQQTPDLSKVVEEIVQRPGWAPGNAITLIVRGSGKRTAVSYNGKAGGAPLLHVEYDASKPGKPTGYRVEDE